MCPKKNIPHATNLEKVATKENSVKFFENNLQFLFYYHQITLIKAVTSRVQKYIKMCEHLINKLNCYI